MAHISFSLSNQSLSIQKISDNQFVISASVMEFPPSFYSEPLTVPVFVIQKWTASGSKHLSVALGTLEAYPLQ
jgi:hypothetical protein